MLHQYTPLSFYFIWNDHTKRLNIHISLWGCISTWRIMEKMLHQVSERQLYKMYMTLPTSMESSTTTKSSFPAKLLLVTQVQWISIRHSCLTFNDFALQAEMVAVETSMDVGNILSIFYDCLCPLWCCTTQCIKDQFNATNNPTGTSSWNYRMKLKGSYCISYIVQTD